MNKKTTFFMAILAILIFAGVKPAVAAQSPVVRAILFYSPTCPHCHQVISEVLPPLMEKYDKSLDIVGIDITQGPGWLLYQSAIDTFQIPEDRQGVPTLIVGSTILVGSLEISDQFTQLIDQGLVGGGIEWPNLPGLEEFIAQQDPGSQDSAPAASTSWIENFQRDPVANSFAVLMLVFVLFTVIRSIYIFARSQASSLNENQGWVVPVFAVIGLAVAIYLAFVESTQSNAVCGPVGDCNAVQQSEYAVLFGLVPIGILGTIGYALVLILWGIQAAGPYTWKDPARLILWGLALIGSLFSLYLTFLEPFVIGATCLWCLSSALIMSVILWVTTPSGVTAWHRLVTPDSKRRRSPRRA